MKTTNKMNTVTLAIDMQKLNNLKAENGRLRTKVGLSSNGRRHTQSVPSQKEGIKLSDEQRAGLQLEASLAIVMNAARRGVDFLALCQDATKTTKKGKQTAAKKSATKKGRPAAKKSSSKVQTAAEIAEQLNRVLV